jgi:fatty acid omega-hydroxylase
MTQRSGGPSSGRRTADAARCKKHPLDSNTKERSDMAELTPWQQALLYANRANPYPFYAELRKTPVSRQPDGSYVISTYREIVSLLHDPRVGSDLRKRPKSGSAPVNGSQPLESAYVHEPTNQV